MPNRKSDIAAGSGTVVIKPLKSRCELSVWNMTAPFARKSPALFKYWPVPPVRVKVSMNEATPLTGGSVIVPMNVPKIVLPPPKSQSNRPLKILPVATLMQ